MIDYTAAPAPTEPAPPTPPARFEALRRRKAAELSTLREAVLRFRSSVPAIDKPWRPEKPRPVPKPWDLSPLPKEWRRPEPENYDPAGPYRPPESLRAQPLALPEPMALPEHVVRNLFIAGR